MTMMDKKIVFIGAGNMAEALVRGMLTAGVCGSDLIRVADVNANRLSYFKKTYSVAGSSNNANEARTADVLVLSVKPQIMAEVIDGIKDVLPETALVISIAAGISTGSIESSLNPGTRLIRVMPNAPAMVGCGVAAFACGAHAAADDMEVAEAMFRSVGIIVQVEECLLDAVTALSGSGPAYVFWLAEAMIEAGLAMGFDTVTAKALTTGTIEGAARMLADTKLDPAQLRDRVASKGGTTEAALDVLQRAEARDMLIQAILAARNRSKELSL